MASKKEAGPHGPSFIERISGSARKKAAAWEFPLPIPAWARYLLTVLMFFVTLGIRFLILPVEAGLAFLTFYPATAFSALLFGTGPGFLTVLLSATIAPYFFIAPYSEIKFHIGWAFSTGTFTFSGVVICLLVMQMFRRSAEVKEANIRLAAAKEELQRRGDELELLNERLTELDRAKTEFFSNVSHEFRTPLTLALGPLEDLLAKPEGALLPQTRASLLVVHRNALRLLKLVNSLLDFSRIEAGRAQAAWEATDLASFTADLASNFQSACERAGVKFIVDCPPLPQPVEVDRGMWEKVVLNLISNAIKFTFHGRIEVTMRAVDGHAELAVSDTGIGIPKEELSHLFERFYRVEGSAGRTYEGSGIGLALVEELVRLQGGAITAESEEGKGSRFIVRLPLGLKHTPGPLKHGETRAISPHGKAVVEEVLHWLPGAVTASPHAGTGSRGRIVVADDNADMRGYISRLLDEAGYAVEAAADGEAALAACEAHPPDLVLSDVMMPVLDGFGLLKKLRAGERTATLPIILLSARAGEESRIGGLATGADDYLIKPFHAQELVARIEGVIRLARIRRETEAELRRAKETAEEATRLKDKFLSLVSHDLKGPLGAIRGFMQLMVGDLERAGDATMLKYAEVMISSTNRMIAMITELLNIGRLKTGKVVPRLVMLDARELAAKEIDFLAPLIIGKEVRLLNEVPEEVRLCADPALLAEVLQNLLSNAVKFSPKGGAVRVGYPAPGVLAVADEGVGIPAEKRTKLFRYEEATSTLGTQGERGTGLGLPLSYDIVKAHGGELTVESAPGRGSIFSVRLPTSKCPDGVCEESGPACFITK